MKLWTKKSIKKGMPFYLMMLPGLIYLLINNYIPMFGIVLAFKDYKVTEGFFGSEWCGLKNFVFLFRTSEAWTITRNTVLYNVAFIITVTAFSILIAVLLYNVESRIGKKVFQTVILYPYLISIIVVAYIVNAFLHAENGVVNNSILSAFGITPVNWYSEPGYWPFILVFVNLWKNFGYNTVIYLSTLLGIDRTYYEAAMLDGASAWHKFKCITLPFLRPTIITMTLLAVGRMFYSDFGLFYQVPMNSGLLFNVTNTIDTYVYRALMQLGDIGMASASGFYQSIVGLILILAANGIVRRIDKENALI